MRPSAGLWGPELPDPMRRLFVRLLALAGIGAAGVAVSHRVGSRPEAEGVENPLPPCPRGVPNCSRMTRAIPAPPDEVRRAAEAAVRGGASLLTGRADEVMLTDGGLRAIYKTGPFADDLAIEVTPGAAGTSLLHIRSAARTGRSDLGVNRARAQRLVADVQTRLGLGQRELPA